MNCLHCGTDLLHDRRIRGARYCTPACRTAARYQKEKKRYRLASAARRRLDFDQRIADILATNPTCEMCGKPFTEEWIRALGRRVKYCSRDCGRKAHNARKAPQEKQARAERSGTCQACGEAFQQVGAGRPRYWCDACRANPPKTLRQKIFRKYTSIHLPEKAESVSTAAHGAACVQLVAGHLTWQGYYVFLPVAYDAPFDLIRYDGEKFERVEVRSGRDGREQHPHFRKNRPAGVTDLYAVVTPDGGITYLQEELPCPEPAES